MSRHGSTVDAYSQDNATTTLQHTKAVDPSTALRPSILQARTPNPKPSTTNPTNLDPSTAKAPNP